MDKKEIIDETKKEVNTTDKIEVKETLKKDNKITKTLKTILNMIIKPISTNESKEKMQDDIKVSFIITGIISFVMALTSVYNTIFTVVKVKSWYGEVKWVWDNFNFYEAFIKPFFITVIIITAIAFLYYIIGLILKKEVNFVRFLTYSAIAFIPYTFATIILLFITSTEITMIVTGITGAYLFIYPLILSLKEYKLEDNDIKFYVYFIITAIYITTILLVFFSMMNSTMNNIIDLFNF